MLETEALVWFLITIVLFVTLMVVGIYEAVHAYDTNSTTRHRHHWWQRHH